MIGSEICGKKRGAVVGDDGRKAAACAYYDCDSASTTRVFAGEVSARACGAHVDLLLLCRCGTCCACGYAGVEETECPSRGDRTHCSHWWDGPEGQEGGSR